MYFKGGARHIKQSKQNKTKELIIFLFCLPHLLLMNA